MDRSDEPSAFAWIMSGTVGAVVAAGLGKFLLDRRRHRAVMEARAAADAEEMAEVEGHPRCRAAGPAPVVGAGPASVLVTGPKGMAAARGVVSPVPRTLRAADGASTAPQGNC